MLDNKGSWLKQGLILGLSVLVKYNFLAVMFIFFSVLFFMKKLNKNHLKTAVIPVLFFALWTLIVFFGALSNGIDPYYEVKQIFVNLTTGATNLFKIPEKFLENFGLFASFFVFADVYFLYKKKFKSKSIVFLSVFFLFFFMLLATNHLDFRFLTPALPLLCTGQALIIKEFFKSRKLFPVIAVAFFVLLPFLYLNLYKIAYMCWVSPHGIHPISQFILEYETAVNIASPYPEILFWYNIDFNSVYNFGNFTDADSFVNELKANNVTHVIIIPDWCYGRGSNYYNICSFFSDVYREDVKMIYNYDKVFLFRIE